MNNKCKKIILLIVSILALIMMVPPLPLVYAQNNAIGTINATVRISVCGNGTVENGEDCEGGNLQSKTCPNLGYTNGNLSCDISCSFDTSYCIAPTINPDNIPPDNMSSLLPTGYFNIPQTASVISTPSLTTTSQMTFNIPMNSGTGSVVLPKDLVITRTDGANLDPTTLATSAVTTSSLSGFSQSVTVDGALQWGIANILLQFDTPVTISIYVGTPLNGQTLNIVRSTSIGSGWTSDGIVSPATCVVSSGLCTFQATKASYFATNRTAASTPTPTPTPTSTPTTSVSSSSSSNGSSTTTTSSTSTPTPTPVSVASSPPIIPDALKFYMNYLDSNGRIRADELFNVVKNWIDDWKEVLTAVANGETIQTKGRKCDVNQDNRCDIKDLSILLYYVER